MAFEIPPWLSYSPQTSLAAAQAGGQLGLGMAQNTLRSQEQGTEAALKLAQMQMQRDLSDKENARRSWEFEQTLRERAAQNAAERELAAAQFGETQRYHMAGNALDLGKLSATEAYNADRLAVMRDANEIKRSANKGKPTLRNVGGSLYEMDPNDPTKWIERIPAAVKPPYAKPAAIAALTNNLMNRESLIENYGQDWYDRATAYGKGAIPGGEKEGPMPVLGTSPDGSMGWYDPITGELIKEISGATNNPAASPGPPNL